MIILNFSILDDLMRQAHREFTKSANLDTCFEKESVEMEIVRVWFAVLSLYILELL